MDDQWSMHAEDRGLTLEELRDQAAECARQAIPTFEAVLGRQPAAADANGRKTPRSYAQKAVRRLRKIKRLWKAIRQSNADARNGEDWLETLENQRAELLAEKYARERLLQQYARRIEALERGDRLEGGSDT